MDKVTVGSLCKKNAELIKMPADALIDYFDIASIDNKNKTITEFSSYEFGKAPSRARTAVNKNSILVSTVRPNLNAIAFFNIKTPNIPVVSTGFCVLDCKEDTNPLFLFYFLQSKSFIDEMVSKATGASYPAVSDKIVRNALIPAYSYEKQTKIADILDRLYSLATNKKQQLSKLDQLVKARFVEMFDNRKYPYKRIDDVCSTIVDCPHSTPKYNGELKNPAIRTSEIKKGYIAWDSMKYVSDEEYQERTSRLTPTAGDIVYGREGSLGNAAILPEGYKFCLGQRVMLLRPDYDLCSSGYLLHAIISDDIYRQVMKKNNASTVAHVNVKDVKQFIIKLPPLNEQKKFEVELNKINQIKLLVKQSLEKLETLKKSLMQEYFG